MQVKPPVYPPEGALIWQAESANVPPLYVKLPLPANAVIGAPVIAKVVWFVLPV